MQQTKILVIDDSATIRRLVDNELSAADYQVLLSPTAEQGVDMASAEMPDLILLDHQLPGTTGYEVCCQLLADSTLARIPVVISSTLRKKAYVEYVDAPNVVDMLPKPYTTELLLTTVENALNTASMVVQSQSDGSAVPETIGELAEADLWGSCEHFSVREIIDMINCGNKCGLLEVQLESGRVLIYMDRGRIQAATASGLDPTVVSRYMPDSLAELKPVIKVSLAGRQSSAIDSLVELLDNKLLDPRLLRKLLRLQSAILLRKCFSEPVKSFRFEAGTAPPALFAKLPLEISLVALLCEAAMVCELSELPDMQQKVQFARQSVRGQNLDRAGLSSLQMKVMGLLSNPATLEQFCQRTNESAETVYRILCGLESAHLAIRQPVRDTLQTVAFTTNPEQVYQLKSFLDAHTEQLSGKVVSDWLALGLLLRRQQPDVLLVNLDSDLEARWEKLLQSPAFASSKPRLIGLVSPGNASLAVSEEILSEFHDVLPTPFADKQLLALVTGREVQPESNPSPDEHNNPLDSVLSAVPNI